MRNARSILVVLAATVCGCHGAGPMLVNGVHDGGGAGGGGSIGAGGGSGGGAGTTDDGGAPVDAALPPSTEARFWLTTGDQATLFAEQTAAPIAASPCSAPLTLTLDGTTQYQTIEGFGASITDSSASLLMNTMSATQRAQLLTQLFDAQKGIGVSVLRQPVGSSDLAPQFYSYDDLPSGQTDPNLTSFSIARDATYIIPAVKAALAVNNGIDIIATPWSAPAWMKDSGNFTGQGTLIDPDMYDPYANYIVKFIQQYQAAGIPIWAVTPANEPLIDHGGYPTMNLQWYQESNLVRYHLAPALATANIGAHILIFDHNWSDAADYPLTMLNDNADLVNDTYGVAFHCYGGDPSDMDQVHDAYPDKPIYMTECSGGTWTGDFGASLISQFQQLYIGSIRHWAKMVVKWNLVLDDSYGPIGPGGCNDCQGLATIHSDGTYDFNVDYYGMAHVSSFVARGAARIDSNTYGPGSIEDVAFVNPDGGKVLVAINSGGNSLDFNVNDGDRCFVGTLPGGAVGTFTWR
ncbi:MAG TPA: glycoside hydrolase family 30 beta sandwich domain-containing protein [Polyangia bacterium]|nr:glycoside hydrolase family 30 beta sandwich domain-containing protein [Polyangia bacterium]